MTDAIWDGKDAYVFGGLDGHAHPLDEIVRLNSTGGVSDGASALWIGAIAVAGAPRDRRCGLLWRKRDRNRKSDRAQR